MRTSGENRVSSHTSGGAINWMKDVTGKAIMDMPVLMIAPPSFLEVRTERSGFESTWRGFVDISGRFMDKRGGGFP